MKLAFFMPSAINGGVQKIMLNLVNNFSKFKFQITFLIADGRGEMRNNIKKDINIKDLKVRFGKGDIKTILAFNKICKFLKNSKPDILCAAPGFSTVVAIIAKRRIKAKTKIVIMIDNKLSTLKQGKLKHKISYILYKKTYKYADAIIIAHEEGYKDFINSFDINENKIYRIYHPLINKEEIEFAERPNHIWYKNNEKIVLSVGRLVKEKDFPTLISAFKIFKEENKEYKLLILGEGPERENLETIIKESNLEDSVDLYGYSNNPYSFMKYSEMFVLTSVKEAFGNVIVEALASGTQIIATNCNSGGPREILENGKYGILCECGNVDEIANAMRQIKCKRFNKNSLQERGNYFSIDNSVNEYKNIFEKLMKEV